MTEIPMDPQAIHRLAKAMLDSGAAASVVDAEAHLQALRVEYRLDAAEAGSYEHQAALLTGVALARRVFLGGVFVNGELDVPLVAPITVGQTLGEAVCELGAVVGVAGGDAPLVYVGGPARPRSSGFAVRTAGAGWRGGVLPAYSTACPSGAQAMPLAAMLSAALAVNEAFLAVGGNVPAAGKRTVGMSLWAPGTDDWLRHDGAPDLAFLPSRLWLIGLGHLGQAYLWGLGLLPYGDAAQLDLVLQDFDRVTTSTWSTSILTEPPRGANPSLVGVRKTRLTAAWAERRGFTTAICERHFNANVVRQNHEPSIALCGVDNAPARRALDKAGFEFVVSAGLGSGHQDFRTVRLHTLPGERQADEIWRDVESVQSPQEAVPYESMVASGVLDRCGAAILAGTAVGAPFVGAVAAALGLAEVLRLLHGGVVNRLIDLDLTSLEHKVVIQQKRDFLHVNPGFVSVA